MPDTTAAWARFSIFNDILYQFEKDYRAGKNPEPEAYLTGEGENRWRLLLELLHSNLELRLRAGEILCVKDYLLKYPELVQRSGDILSLLAVELRFLKEQGHQPKLEDYEQDYGNLIPSSLKPLFEQPSPKQTDHNLGKLIANRYRLINVLGQGGMGTVYLAEQSEPVKRQVALKLIKAGIDSRSYITRFEAERQALAVMDHPNIARVYDGGTTELQQPYFVMELVQGIPITQYCDQQRLNPKARLELFVLICQAVQHAHQKGIIHRDLKPGNVLVTSVDGKPVPKVIDFGLAKATEQPLTDETIEERGAVGTPAYMSPEQADPENMDVDTRTDLYALGVILYELLTGSTPIDVKQFRRGALLEMLRMVREVDPPKPSTKLSSAEELPSIAANRDLEPKQLLAWIRGDIDWIVMKSLEKDRNRRYETANGFAGDVQRYLNGEAVLAHPPGRWYRLKKFVKRNKVQVVAAGLVFIALLTGLVGTAYGIIKNEGERTANSLREVAENQSEIAKRERDEKENQRKMASNARADAEKARDGEKTARQQVEREREKLTRFEYGRTIQVAQQEWRDNNLTATLALLAGTRPDLRGWEWRYVNKLCHQEILTLKGHAGPLLSATFSLDGSRLVTGSSDMTAKVWDVESGTELLTLKGHQHVISSASFSPDGLRVVTSSPDKTAKLWDLKTGAELLTFKGHTGEVMFASFSPDGSQLVTGSYDKTAKIWDTKTGKEVLTLVGHDYVVSSGSFSPDGSSVLTGSYDMSSIIWDTNTGAKRLTLKGHTSPVLSASFSRDGTRVVTGSYDKTARVWDSKTGTEKQIFIGHADGVNSASYSPDGLRVVTGSFDKTAKVWDTKTGAELHTYRANGVRSVSFSPDGSQVVTAGSSDTAAKFWDAKSSSEFTTLLTVHPYNVNSASFSPDGSRIVTSGGNDKTARVWDAVTGAELLTFKGHSSGIFQSSFSLDGTRVVTAGGADKTVKVWDAKSGNELLNFKWHGLYVTSAKLSPDGSRVVIAGYDKIAKVWDTKTGAELLTLKGHKGNITSVSYSPDGLRIVTISQDSTAILWDARTGAVILVISRPINSDNTYFFTSVSYSPDGSQILTGNNNKTANVWDVKTGAELLTLRGHTGSVTSAVFSPDGLRVLTAGREDKTIKVWDAKTGAELLALKGQSSIGSALFSPDGSRIVGMGMNDGVLRIWDARPINQKWQMVKHKLDTKLDLSKTNWTFKFDKDNISAAQTWSTIPLDTSWLPINIGLSWNDQGFDFKRGSIWYRLQILLPDNWKQGHYFLQCDGIDDYGELYLDGSYLGTMGDLFLGRSAYVWPGQFTLHGLKPGIKYQLAIRVVNLGGGGGIHRPIVLSQQPLDLIATYRRMLPEHERHLNNELKMAKPIEGNIYASREILAFVHEELNELQKAETLLRINLDAVKQGKCRERILSSAALALAANLNKQKKWSEAEALFRECHAVQQKSQPSSWRTHLTTDFLGEVQLSQKKYSEAEQHLLKGYQGMKKNETSIPPQYKSRLTESLDRLIQLYTETNKPDEVKKWQAEKAKLTVELDKSKK